MRATTHTEVYRPFNGEFQARPFRARTLAWSGVRVGFRKKLPALLLFFIPAILTIVTAFVVKLMFDAEAGTLMGEQVPQATMLGAALKQTIGDVENQILQLIEKIQIFVVLVLGWYGSGLIAEDRRLRANLLYFARPLTRWTYALGKLGTALFWGSCAVVLPVIIVCSVAASSSPDWVFLLDRWPTILKLLAFACMWVIVHSLLVLAISSLCERRNHALAGLFGFYLLTMFGAEALSRIFDGAGWQLMSIPRNFQRLSAAMFDTGLGRVPWSLEATLWTLGILTVACVVVLQRQTRKMEVGS